MVIVMENQKYTDIPARRHAHPSREQAGLPRVFRVRRRVDRDWYGDHWLSVVVPQLLAQPGVTVILTWDEAKKTSGQHIVTLEVGAGITPGSSDGNAYNHYGLEAGLYGVFGLGPPPNNGATAPPLPIP